MVISWTTSKIKVDKLYWQYNLAASHVSDTVVNQFSSPFAASFATPEGAKRGEHVCAVDLLSDILPSTGHVGILSA